MAAKSPEIRSYASLGAGVLGLLASIVTGMRSAVKYEFKVGGTCSYSKSVCFVFCSRPITDCVFLFDPFRSG
jgi:hypothetical protein